MAGIKVTQLPLATSLNPTDVIIGQTQGKTSKIPIELLQGLTGVKGDTGDTGAQGAPGDQGIQGDPGYDGPAGPQGAQGPAGSGTPDRLVNGDKSFILGTDGTISFPDDSIASQNSINIKSNVTTIAGGTEDPGNQFTLNTVFPSTYPTPVGFEYIYEYTFDPNYSVLTRPGIGTIAEIINNGLTINAIHGMSDIEPTALTNFAIAPGTKTMFSATIDRNTIRSGDGWCGIGVAVHNMDLNTYLGQNQWSVGFYEQGAYYGDLDGFGSPDPYTAGDTIDVAVDRVNGLIWNRVNGGDWNGNPSADPENAQGGFILPAFEGASLYFGVTPTNVSTPGQQSIKTWTFDTDGKLQLPAGGDIVDSNGDTVLGMNVEQRYFDYVIGASLHGRSGLAGANVSHLGDDDNEYLINLPFSVQFLGQTYSQVWLNSNSYLTFASVVDNSPSESSIYWPISPAMLAVPSITVGASDRAINKYYYGSTNDGRFVIGYEGSIKNSINNLNAPSTRIWEAWFYESEPGRISIVVDANLPPGGVWGLHDGVKWIDVYEELPRLNQETDFLITNGIDIYTKPPQSANTIKFSGAGVETYFEGNEAFVTINPLQGLVNLDMDEYGNTIITSAGYELILKSNHDNDITIDSGNDVNINAKTPDRENPGDGRDVNINAGGGYGTSGSNYNGGDVNLTAGNSFGSSGSSGNVNINSGNKGWRFGTDGVLNLPNNNGQIGQLESPYTGLEFRTGSGADWIGISYGEINDNNTSYFYFDKDGSDYTTANHRAHLQLKNATRDGHLEWLFDSNGNLTLPTGGDIKDSGGNSVLGATGGTNLPSGATGYLYNDGSDNLSWNNIYMNFDGGASSTVFSPSDMSLDGSNANLGLASISITSVSSYGNSAQVYVNLADNGGYNLTDIGVVWSSAHNPTTADNKIQANPTGASFSVTTGYIPEGTVYIRAYATNSNGTSYSEEQEFTSYICLIKGTLITLADGSTKKIEDIEYSDSLLVWNFDEGKFDSANPVFIAMPSPVMKEHNILKFSDGTELRTILKDIGHRIFNIEAGKFTHPMTDETPIGTTTFKDDESKVALVSQEIVREDGIFYNILTNIHINVFANGILTSARLNNIYPTEEMKFVKEQINSRSREEFDWVSDEIFKGLRLGEQPKEFDTIQYNLKAKINLMKPKN